MFFAENGKYTFCFDKFILFDGDYIIIVFKFFVVPAINYFLIMIPVTFKFFVFLYIFQVVFFPFWTLFHLKNNLSSFLTKYGIINKKSKFMPIFRGLKFKSLLNCNTFKMIRRRRSPTSI